jgi:hypothetical protein
MAEAYSEQTQAIVDRLKAEGQLIRNTGTNSIKSMNIKLDKFQGLFKSINNELMFQTDMLRQSLEIEQNIQRDKQLSEVAVDPPTASETPEGKGKGKSSTSTEERKSLGGILGGILGTLRNILVKGALVVGAGVLGFEFMRGFIDERTDGAFTKFFDDVNWTEMGANMKLLALTLKNKVVSFTNFLNDPLGSIMSNMTTEGVATAGFMTAAGLAAAVTGGGDEKSNSRKLKIGSFVRFGALGLMLTGVGYASDALKENIDGQDWSKEKIGSLTKGDLAKAGIDVAEGALKGASIGMMFGPGGAMVGAVLGATVTLGFKAYEWWNDRKKKNQAQMDMELAAAEALYVENAEDFKKLIMDMSTLAQSERERIYASLSKEAQGAVDLALERNEEADLRARVTDLYTDYTNLKKGGGQTAFATDQAERDLRAAQQELDNYILQKSGRAQYDVAPRGSMSDADYYEFMRRFENGRSDYGYDTYNRDRTNYFARIEAVSNEAMLKRARAMGNAELMAGYMNYGTQDQLGLSDFAQGFRRDGGVTFMIRKELKNVLEDAGIINPRNTGPVITYREGDNYVQGDTIAPTTKTDFSNYFSTGVAPAGSEFPGYEGH